MKVDKIVNEEKLLKIGLGLGRGDLKVEGNFQMGWHRRCNKSYKHRPPDDTQLLVAVEEPEQEQEDTV